MGLGRHLRRFFANAITNGSGVDLVGYGTRFNRVCLVSARDMVWSGSYIWFPVHVPQAPAFPDTAFVFAYLWSLAMTGSLIGAFIWFLLANLAAIIPSNDNHWRRAYVLIAVGIPLLGWVTVQNGPIIGLLCLGAGVSVLRWPVRYLTLWIRRKLFGNPTAE